MLQHNDANVYRLNTKFHPQLLPPGDIQFKDIPPIATDVVINCLNKNEVGDAELFSIIFKGLCIRDHTSSKWYIWQGHYWSEDTTKQIRHMISGVLSAVYIRAAGELRTIEKRSTEEEAVKIKETIKKLFTRQNALTFTDRIRKVLDAAESFLPLTSSKWDSNPWLLGTKDGAIDLKTGELSPGKPEDYVRTTINAEYKGLQDQANCPRFLQFLDEIFSDRSEEEREKLIAFLQRVLGYGITGIVRDHAFLLFYGDQGRNGKDTLMSLMYSIMGDTIGAIQKDVLLATGKGAQPGAAKPHLIRLQGKRIAWASEPEKGERFSIGQVKDLTGGGMIVARSPYDKHDTAFMPSHLLLLLTNHKPHADAGDNAFWKRLFPIVFNMQFVDKPRKKNERLINTELDQALKAEGSAVLSWLVQGCLNWQKEGLNPPDAILAERETYRLSEDTVATALAEICYEHPTYQVKANILFKLYIKWCEDNNLKGMSGTAFGLEMSRRFTRLPRKSDGIWYEGLGIQEAYPEPDTRETERRELVGKEPQQIAPGVWEEEYNDA